MTATGTLKKLLEYRRKALDAVRRRLAEAMAGEQAVQDALAALAAERREAGMPAAGAAPLPDLLAVWFRRLDARRGELEAALAAAQAHTATVREELMDAAQEAKAIEAMLSRRLEEEALQARRQEQAELLEQIITRAAARKGEDT
jgi:flagellar export protein FliJ